MVVAGLIPILLGQLLRFWAVGCIVLYRGEMVKAEKLVTWGPYSIFRNPLYVANGLIGLGWGLMAGLWGLALFLITFLVLYVLLIIPWEERFLLAKFGDEYRDYSRSVGAFGPKRWPPRFKKGPFEPSVIWKSEIHSVMVTVIGTAVLISRIWW